jgi:aminotransferase
MRALSRRASFVQQSEIRAMTLACNAVDGINLAQGICDTEVPLVVRRAAQAAIDEGFNIYSRYDGLDELRQALTAKMQRYNGLTYDVETEVVVTLGATGAFYVAATALLNPGDEVILFEPFYGYHVNTLHALDAIPVFVATQPPAWDCDAGALASAITPRTRAIVINTPGNPSGKVFTVAELAQIADLACRHDLFVFTDEVYEHFVFDGRRHVSPATLPGMRERTITMSSLSKTLAVTGWRLGWMAADARWTRAFGPLNDLFYICAPSPLQLGAARGLMALDASYYGGIVTEYQAKRDQLCVALERAGLPPCTPQGAYYILADIGRLPGATSKERVMHLLQRTGVAAVPGEAFFRGEEGHRMARFCFGKTDADLAAACARLATI